MKDNYDSYYAFGQAVLVDKLHSTLSYEEICRHIGADASSLERILQEELGYGGPELVDRLRRLDSFTI